LLDAGEISEAEYVELLSRARGARKATRKQRAAAMRNLRRACGKLEKPKPVSVSPLEHKVRKLRSEIREAVRKEELKEEHKRLRAERARLREALKSKRGDEGFMLGKDRFR
jgi:hypothetical protein